MQLLGHLYGMTRLAKPRDNVPLAIVYSVERLANSRLTSIGCLSRETSCTGSRARYKEFSG